MFLPDNNSHFLAYVDIEIALQKCLSLSQAPYQDMGHSILVLGMSHSNLVLGTFYISIVSWKE